MSGKEATVAVVIGLLFFGFLSFVAWTVHQGTLGWQRTYETCLQEGSSPVECKVRVNR